MAERVAEVLKRPGCRLIRFENGDSLLVPWMLFCLFPLRAGDTVDCEEYQKQLRQKEDRLALEQAVRLLKARDRSRQEVWQRLQAQGYSDGSIALAVERLSRASYLDDARYARNTIARLGKKYGPIRLKSELTQKGLSAQHIEDAMEEQDSEFHLQAAIAYAQKALKSSRGDERAVYRRLYAALARRGYPPDLVRKALSAVLDKADATEEY